MNQYRAKVELSAESVERTAESNLIKSLIHTLRNSESVSYHKDSFFKKAKKSERGNIV